MPTYVDIFWIQNIFQSSKQLILWDLRLSFKSCGQQNRFMVFFHDDVIKWKHLPRYWPFVRGIHRSGPGEFPSQRPVTRSFNVSFDLRLNKRLSKQSQGW